MKNIFILFACFCLFTVCNAQQTENYNLREEYGIKGNVKEITMYACPAKNNKIPENDTLRFTAKYTITFDELGNGIQSDKIWKSDIAGSTIRTNKTIFSGTGKNISYKDISTFKEGKVIEQAYQYVWLDDFTYKIIPKNDETYSQTFTLDKDRRITKMVMRQGDLIEIIEDMETIYNNGKVEKTITVTKQKREGGTTSETIIEVTKAYDDFGNPTVIYSYDNADEQKVKDVIFKTYKYY